MSQPLGAADIFSAACHPSQTVHQLVSLQLEVSDTDSEEWCYIVAYRTSGNVRVTAPTYTMQQNPGRSNKLQ